MLDLFTGQDMLKVEGSGSGVSCVTQSSRGVSVHMGAVFVRSTKGTQWSGSSGPH